MQSAEEDLFNLLPDAVLLLVFNAVRDVKYLGRLAAVSRRFRRLVHQSESVLVNVDCVVSSSSSTQNRHYLGFNATLSGERNHSGILSVFARMLFSTFVSRPLNALHQVFLPKKVLFAAEICHHSPSEVLRRFREVKSLKIVLPSGELGIDPGAVFFWKAEFGVTLESCVILSAMAIIKKKSVSLDGSAEGYAEDEEDQSFCTNGGLKLRVVWTITSLIAASARHFLLREIIKDHSTVQFLEVADANGQGVLHMGKEQLDEFRSSSIEVACSLNRTQVPALNMKLWHASRVVMGNGDVMEGATLVSIRPVSRMNKVDEQDKLAIDAFEGQFREAAGILAKRKAYLLEMNPF